MSFHLVVLAYITQLFFYDLKKTTTIGHGKKKGAAAAIVKNSFLGCTVK
jgi:hypothetical protein